MATKIKELRKKYDGKLMARKKDGCISILLEVDGVFWDNRNKDYYLDCSAISISIQNGGVNGFSDRGKNHWLYVNQLRSNGFSLCSKKIIRRHIVALTNYLLNFCGMAKEDLIGAL